MAPKADFNRCLLEWHQCCKGILCGGRSSQERQHDREDANTKTE